MSGAGNCLERGSEWSGGSERSGEVKGAGKTKEWREERSGEEAKPRNTLERGPHSVEVRMN